MTKIDSAILKALSSTGLDTANAKIVIHGGSGFASTYRVTTPETSIFVKTSNSSGARVMFEGEHASLNAIHDAVPSLCPEALGWGELDRGGGYFLATEFLDLGGRSSGTAKSGRGGKLEGSGMSLAQKLAKLHTTPAPTPEGYDKPQFGFPVTTCCGETPQDNSFESSWAEFFGRCRLLMILSACENNQGKDPDLRRTVERTVAEVIPRLLGEGHLGGKEGVKPVVCHGDLWSGNKGKGVFVGRDGEVEDVVFDPSAVYGHNEYDLGIMNMFGGFGSGFFREYHAICPKTEPVTEYEDRLNLYEAYHHLNHHAMFGGYKSGAMNLLKGLLKKYGTKEVKV